jgi:hypothetical protein
MAYSSDHDKDYHWLGTRDQSSRKTRTERRIVIGLDFGTYPCQLRPHLAKDDIWRCCPPGTYGTGIAHKLPGQNIGFEYTWPGMVTGFRYPKTLTAILYKKKIPIAWGWEARNKYWALKDSERRDPQYVYLDRFKLALDTSSTFKALPAGFTAVKVISDFLRMFKVRSAL